MTKLKTLKELENYCCGAGEYCSGDNRYELTEKSISVHSFELRQEAIKWIKALNMDYNDKDYWEADKHNVLEFKFCKDICYLEYEMADRNGAISILKHLFNIK